MKDLYWVEVTGCDDTTSIKVELEPYEAIAVERVARMVTAASSYKCQPTMRMHKVNHIKEDIKDV